MSGLRAFARYLACGGEAVRRGVHGHVYGLRPSRVRSRLGGYALSAGYAPARCRCPMHGAL